MAAAMPTGARALYEGSRPGASDYTRGRAYHSMMGGPTQDLNFVRSQHAAALGRLSEIEAERARANQMLERGSDAHSWVMQDTRQRAGRERAFINRVETDEFRLQQRIGNMSQRAHVVEEESSNKALAAANRELAQTRKEAARLERANFQADISGLSPHSQRSRILARAGETDDPMEAAMLRRQAGTLRGKSGLNREVMSTGMMMNFMFGGWEVASAFNAMNATTHGAAMSSPVENVRAQAAAIQQIAGGPLGAITLGAFDVPDAISRAAGGRGYNWSPRAFRDAMYGMERGLLGDQAAVERMGLSRALGASVREMDFAGYAARDPNRFRSSRASAVRANEERIAQYNAEIDSLKERAEAASSQEDYDKFTGQATLRLRNRDKFIAGSTRQMKGELTKVEREEARDSMDRAFDLKSRTEISAILAGDGSVRGSLRVGALRIAGEAAREAMALGWAGHGADARTALAIGRSNLKGFEAGMWRGVGGTEVNANFTDFKGAPGQSTADNMAKAIFDASKKIDDANEYLRSIEEKLSFETR